MNSIYLVGQISPKYQETYLWRERVHNEFNENENFSIIDPCKNPFNKKMLDQKTYAINNSLREGGIDVLVPKDYTFVRNSNIAIVNLNHYDVIKPMIGSFFELAWYYSHPHKTVIAFCKDLNEYQCQHPFVKQSVTAWCNNEIEACDLIKYYFEQ